MTAESTMKKSDIKMGVVKRAIQLVVSGAVIGVAMLIPAGRLDWPLAWIYIAVYFAAILFNAVFVLGKDPELIAERGETKENIKAWDRRVTTLLTIATFLTLIVAGLDARVDWSKMPLPIVVGAWVVFILGFGIVSWSMGTNRYFSRVVRIQSDRGQKVCSSGPYRFVRHPGYVGMCIYSFATAPGLGSYLALVPALLTVIMFVVRTKLEDQMLCEELPGYREYASVVRNRLLPGVW
jgi:protein-S-isoprenylcysteine O-methyltransferase Ste14